jgi:selenide,water dikinase
VLRPLQFAGRSELIVGLHTSDDAAVFRLRDDLAIVQTIDFFTPIVDDPYHYGAIAAANSLSDVYAMGGDPLLALNVAAFPEDLPAEMIAEILRGGLEKAQEAGAVIAGGHTVTDAEPKYGLSVTGTIHPDRVLTKAGAKPTDRLFLTKPIGTGVITTAAMNDAAAVEHLGAAVASMLRLNRQASDLIRTHGATACTDVTGFGLLGHAWEMADRGSVRLELRAGAVPLLSGALDCARAHQIPGGLSRNRAYYLRHGVEIAAGVDREIATLLFDPQTSGGLLFTLPDARSAAAIEAFERSGVALWEIGTVAAGRGVTVTG